MAKQPLERRVEVLESEVARLKRELSSGGISTTPWWRQIAGVFADDPAFETAMRLGRQYRQRNRSNKAGADQNGHSRHGSR